MRFLEEKAGFQRLVQRKVDFRKPLLTSNPLPQARGMSHKAGGGRELLGKTLQNLRDYRRKTPIEALAGSES